MISSYLLRLCCLSFATFFLAYLVLSLASFAGARMTIGLAKRKRPEVATRLLLSLRLVPLAVSVFLVLGLCLPSYLLLEPEARVEQVGLACLVAALGGVAVWLISAGRTVRAVALSMAAARRSRRVGRPLHVPGQSLPVYVIDSERPLLALAGLFRPRIVVSQGIVDALSPEQLDAALGHEQAHWTSRDNLKRLLLMLAPDPFPFYRGARQLDRNWSKFTEWLADDRAVAGDSGRSLTLAAALVRVARLGSPARYAPLMATLAGPDDDLSIRVDRLLRPEPAWDAPSGRTRWLASGATVAALIVVTFLIVQPATMYSVHQILELLIH